VIGTGLLIVFTADEFKNDPRNPNAKTVKPALDIRWRGGSGIDAEG